MNFREFLKDNIVILDGGMGTQLQKAGLKPGEGSEKWNLSHASVIVDVQRKYFDAGSNLINTNTFGANGLKYEHEELTQIICAAIDNSRRARSESSGNQPKFIALNLGPCGKLLKPYGDLDFEDAVALFSEIVKIGVNYGVDALSIETMNDIYETKAALLAIKENTDLPVIVMNAYGSDGKLMTGAEPKAVIAMLEGMHADAIGVNCSLGPDALVPVINEYLKYSSVPVIMKPNAGLPQVRNNETVYDLNPEDFAAVVASCVKNGVRVAGGCCGTDARYITALTNEIRGIKPVPLTEKSFTMISSYTHSVEFADVPVLIGERINPTGKKRFKTALIENDIDYILREGLSQADAGVAVLDVNVGLPDIDEVSMLTDVVRELQTVTDLPLQIDTANPDAMESALRRYNGKALINSVNGKEESMNAIFPLVALYGGVVIALTLDDNGIPDTVEGRIKIAERIIKRASEYGISKKDIIFDPLALTISADNRSALITLDSIEYIRKNLGCHTSLGVSNVSFGLPERDSVNSTFFACALERGLSAAIMNPFSQNMIDCYYSYLALHGMDEACKNYIIHMQGRTAQTAVQSAPAASKGSNILSISSELQEAIIRGLKDSAAKVTQGMLQGMPPLDIVSNEIIPALDLVGKSYENKTIYLPQLLTSAEAAKAAFEVIKTYMISHSQSESQTKKCTFVIATVRGDIHDIGKNIVRLLLENYGFNVIDLGKDVPVESVVNAVIQSHAPLVGLSALMTTTVPAMEATIKQLHEKAPWAKVVVGGAVLNQSYADMIKADKYAGDAMETVRYAEMIYGDI